MFTYRIQRMGEGYVFDSRQSEGVPHLHPTILPLIPCSFQGGTPSPSHNTSIGPMSFLGGYPSQVRMGNPPPQLGQGLGTPARSGWDTPKPPSSSRTNRGQYKRWSVRILQFPKGGLSFCFMHPKVEGRSYFQLCLSVHRGGLSHGELETYPIFSMMQWNRSKNQTKKECHRLPFPSYTPPQFILSCNTYFKSSVCSFRFKHMLLILLGIR